MFFVIAIALMLLFTLYFIDCYYYQQNTVNQSTSTTNGIPLGANRSENFNSAESDETSTESEVENLDIPKCAPRDQLIAEYPSVLIITCIDFRLIDDALYYMNRRGYVNDYDQFILIGGSLGYNTGMNLSKETQYSNTIPSSPKDPNGNIWQTVADQHIETAINLHGISKIILMDHTDCAAFKLFYKLSPEKYSDTEDYHLYNMSKMMASLKKKFKRNNQGKPIIYEALICDLEGGITNVTDKLDLK